ncbi:scavenger receptor cysteine-rich type 1 protein M160 [Pseudorasbora parva]|uniref:scavenger receptor cysteine-rich type 1 protein M160 n=1 Tax=Pseudorasbora parva TaxID=51549 RepID=UPI00351DF46C
MCGDVVESGQENNLYKDASLPKNYWMNYVKCKSNETSLLDCAYFEDKICSKNEKEGFVAVECKGKVALRLNLNGLYDRCAGAVEFSTENGTFGVCNSNNNAADMICQELGCGKSHYTSKLEMSKGQQSKQNVNNYILLKCNGEMKYSWQCMEPFTESSCLRPATVICTKYKRFRLQKGNNVCSGLVEMQKGTDQSWIPLQAKDLGSDLNASVICTQLKCGASGYFDNGTDSLRLTCSDSVKVLNSSPNCFGDVSVNVNGSTFRVCYNNVHAKLGLVVCQELGCGTLLAVEKDPNYALTKSAMHFECQGDETSLWHCLANEINDCQTATVICAGSLDVRLSNGLGDCSGRVELKWKGSWKPISFKDWSTENSNVVCEHLKCGKSSNVSMKETVENKWEQLKTSWDFKCGSSSAKLHECWKQGTSNPIHARREPNVEIFCQNENIMLFEGDSPCRGIVHIKRFDDVKAQIPANETEAIKICHLMQCGPLNHRSFEKQLNSTYINVTCSGSVRMALRNNLNEKCWGKVEVCREEKSTECRGVCSYAWEDKYSEKLCEDLECGDPITSQLPREEKSVSISGVYCLTEGQKMSTCKFTDSKDSCAIKAVVCSGSIKAKLEDPRDKCAGKVSLFYSGMWTPVCQESLTNKHLKDLICRELNCGEFESNLVWRDEYITTGISGIQCLGSAKSVSECTFTYISTKRCTPGYLKCTGWQRFYMYKKDASCSGPVYSLLNVNGTEKSQLVSGQGWGKEEGQKLCEYLQCGNYTSHENIYLPEETEWWNKTYNCSGKKNIWECERQDQAVTLNAHLNISCDGNPDIKLSSHCTGKVLINNKHVCGNHYYDQMANRLCESLGCGNATYNWTSANTAKKNCLHLSCTGHEMRLGQCGNTEDKCEDILSVACRYGIMFGSTEKCGGKLVVNYRNQWEYVCGELNNTAEVCQKLNCNTPVSEKDIRPDTSVTINCPKSHHPTDPIGQCVHLEKGRCRKPAEIKCQGYIEKTPPVSSGLIVGLTLAMLALLIMVFMWMNRKRLLLALRHYRNKNGKDIKTDRNEMNNMDTKDKDLSQGSASSLEYDDYADVDTAKNKTGEEDADNRSAGSSGTEYDDIEGQNSDTSPHQTHTDDEVPLLPMRSVNMLDQDTYEVETEKQEDYDDVIPVENVGRAAQAQVDVDVDAGIDSESDTGVNGDAVVVTTEVEVHAKLE